VQLTKKWAYLGARLVSNIYDRPAGLYFKLELLYLLVQKGHSKERRKRKERSAAVNSCKGIDNKLGRRSDQSGDNVGCLRRLSLVYGANPSQYIIYYNSLINSYKHEELNKY
jgi:hypothetical protein